jgi:hypothetical protein
MFFVPWLEKGRVKVKCMYVRSFCCYSVVQQQYTELSISEKKPNTVQTRFGLQ